MKKSNETSGLLCDGFSAADSSQIQKALSIIAQIPEDPGYDRPKGIEVAAILKGFNVDLKTLLAAILSDSRVSKLDPKPDIKGLFGDTVAALVKDVNWLNTFSIYSLDMADKPSQAENLRRMLLSMTEDVRSVLIKLAFRVKRLQLLARESCEMRGFIAQETLDIYAPIANRMGIHQLKWQLEDMAFRYLKPQAYQQIAKSLADKRAEREQTIGRFIQLLQEILTQEGIPAEITGRPKHIYSIWKKMQWKHVGIDELHDLLAVRVMVDNLSACYAVLGFVHATWQYIPKEFDDYIANPKENGYQSLHTVILDPDGKCIEVQIRTRKMHEYAELGVAAHWSYKEGGKHNAAVEKSIASLRKLLAERGNEELSQASFHNELFSDRVYVLTPKGLLLDLVKGSTVLDFAYAVHTEIGHRCRGAKVNGRIVPLTYPLKSGERVEILTVKEGAPNRNWIDPNLGYLKSAMAISKVKSWFKNQQQNQNIAAGKVVLDQEVQRLGIKPPNLTVLAKQFKQASTDKFLEALGRSDISPAQLAAYFKIPGFEEKKLFGKPFKKKLTPSSVSVNGVDNVLTHFASCCSPVPGDPVIGYISHKKGVTVHRLDCPNILGLSPEKHVRLVPVSWGAGKSSHSVTIVIKAYSTQTLMPDVMHVLAQAKIHTTHANMETHPDFSSTLKLTIQVENADRLSQVLGKLSCIPEVIDVKRKT